MNRFKTSKYKNTTPKIGKKDEWINNVRGGSFSCQGNHIKASSELVAFNTEQAGGGMLGLTSVRPGSDGQWTVTHISCHSDLVTDMDFSPFDEYVLATCSGDETVKLWYLCDPEQQQPSDPMLTLHPGQGRLELLQFHPTSSGLLAVGTTKSALIWDTNRKDAPLAALEQHGDQMQSLSWKRDGSLLASSCKDKMLRVFDPRAQLTPVQSFFSKEVNGFLGSVFFQTFTAQDDVFVAVRQDDRDRSCTNFCTETASITCSQPVTKYGTNMLQTIEN